MRLTRTTAFGSLLALAFAASAGTAAAQQDSQAGITLGESVEADMEMDFTGDSPYLKSDDAFVTLSGEVTDATVDAFMLDYGDGTVKVEMDDWDNWGDAYGIVDGQTVAVTGEIDDDFLETTTIEASSVYVADLNTNFYASSADEEALRAWRPYAAADTNGVTFNGIVTETMPVQGEFVMDTGYYDFEVDASELSYDPLDGEGFQEIEAGDMVTVTGEMTDPLFDDNELKATIITTSAS